MYIKFDTVFMKRILSITAMIFVFAVVSYVLLPKADFLNHSEGKTASSSDSIYKDDEEEDTPEDIKLINDLDEEELSKEGGNLASGSDALIKTDSKVEFYGLEGKTALPGQSVNVIENVGAKLEDYPLHVDVLEIKSEDGQTLPVDEKGIVRVPDEVGKNYKIKYLAYSPNLKYEENTEGAATEAEDKKNDANIVSSIFTEFVHENKETLLNEGLGVKPEELENSEIVKNGSTKDELKSLKTVLNNNENLSDEEKTALLDRLAEYPESTIEAAYRIIAGSTDEEQILPLALSTGDLSIVAMGSAGEITMDHERTSLESNYTTTAGQGKITYNGATLTEDLTKPYITIRVPIENLSERLINSSTGQLEALGVSPEANIDSVSYTVETDGAGQRFAVAKIVLKTVRRGQRGSILYNVNFKNSRVIPTDYELKASTKSYASDGEELGTAHDVTYKVKYDDPVMDKYGLSNRDMNNKLDNYLSMYGGTSTNGIVTTATDVPFMFNTNTKEYNSRLGMAPAIYKYRLLERIELVDTLPTYKNELTGQTVPAQFDLASNPGWSIVETDASGRATKVKYTAQSASDDVISGGADTALRSIKLNLKFPGLKVNSLNNGGYPSSIALNNRAQATLIPYNETAAEAAQRTVLSDAISFRIGQNEVGSGAIAKRVVQFYDIDPGYVHMKNINYAVHAKNTTAYTLHDLKVTDYEADERTYYHSIEFSGQSGTVAPSQVKEIWGLDASGARIKKLYSRDTDGALPSLGEDVRKTVYLDTEARDEIESYVNRVEAGTIAENDVPAVARRLEAVEVIYDGEVPRGELVTMNVRLAFRDPYHLTDTPQLVANSVKLDGTYTDPQGVQKNLETDPTKPLKATVATKLRSIEQKIDISKVTLDNKTGTVGDNILYRVTVDFRKMGRGNRYRNPKVIEVLPIGVRYRAISIPSGNILNASVTEVIENYKDSGRQALVISMNNFRVNDFLAANKLAIFQFNLSALITSEAFADGTGLLPSSLNTAYFTADGLYPLSPSVGLEKPDILVDDKYDVDNNPATDKVLGASSPTVINTAGSIKAAKEIRKTGGNWVRDKIYTDYGETFDYSFIVSSAGMGDIGKMIIYDVFPSAGDSQYTGQGGGSRGSEFSNTLNGPVVTPPGYTVYYSTNPNPDMNASTAVSGTGMGWSASLPADLSQVRAIKIVMNSGTKIANNTTERFIVPMKAPEVPSTGYFTTEKAAINDYVISYDDGNLYGLVNSVKNVMGKAFDIEKQWDGGVNRPNIKVKLKRNGQYYTNAAYPDGTIELSAASGWKGSFTNLPFKSEDGNVTYTYTIEEVGVGSGDLTGYVANISGNDSTGFLVKNLYMMVPPTGITKDNAPFVIILSVCALASMAFLGVLLRKRRYEV